MWLAVALMITPACGGRVETGCGGCGNPQDSSSPQGCGGSQGGALFNFDVPIVDCDDASNPGPHVLSHGCHVACEDGWFDCNNEAIDGCESTTECSMLNDAGTTTVEWLQTLSDEPLGLVVCGKDLVYADGALLVATDKSGGTMRTLALLDRAPTGGLACDNNYVYLALRDASDGGSKDGRVAGVRLKDAGSDAMVSLIGVVDPARSIDLDDAGGVFWLTRRDAGTFLTRNTIDASDGLLLPIDEPQTYKTFALYDGVWAIGGGDVRHRYADGAVDLLADANAVAITARPSGVTVLTGIDGGAQLGDASFMSTRAMTSFGSDVFIATDDSITHVSPLGALSVVASKLSHVVDLAADDQYVYFTTLGPPATLQRAAW